MRVFSAVLMAVTACLPLRAAYAAFDLVDQDGAVTVTENGKPVLVYHYQPVAAPTGVLERYTRACYIHPLYGLDGDVLTQDFPLDHFHHRGVFWAWPECTVGGRRMDVWALDGVRQRHEKWTVKEAKADRVDIGAINCWSFDDAPDKRMVEEEVRFTVFPATDTGRIIDFALKFTNVSGETVTFLGAKNKGYGGFCCRANAQRGPLVFTSSQGVSPEDVLKLDSPWADVVLTGEKGPKAGLAIFQNRANPGYPFPGWIFRHYGFLGASWPHETTHVMKPGDVFELKYRTVIHRGSAEDAGIAKQFAEYAK